MPQSRLRELVERRVVVERPAQRVEQAREQREVAAAGRGIERCLDAMVTRDDSRACEAHRLGTRPRGRHRARALCVLALAACAPPRQPWVRRLRIGEQRAQHVVAAFGRGCEVSPSQREVHAFAVKQREPVVGERGVLGIAARGRKAQPQPGALPLQQCGAMQGREAFEHLVGLGHRALRLAGDQRHQALGEPRQVPARDLRLPAERVAPAMVDRTEHRVGIVDLEEGAGTVVDRLARQCHVVGVHHAVDEADVHPLRHQRRLPAHHRVQQRQESAGLARERGIVPCDRVVGEPAHVVVLAACREELEGAHADVARGHASEHRTRQHLLAEDLFTGGHDRECPRGGNAQRMHRLADQHLAQHRPDRGLAVSAARKGRAARALEGEVATASVAIDDLAQQQCPAVAELWREAAELVAGVGLRDRLGPFGQHVAGEQCCPFRTGERRRIQPQLVGQRCVQVQQLRCRHGIGLPGDVEAGQLARVAVVEAEGGCSHRCPLSYESSSALANSSAEKACRSSIPSPTPTK
ncbi:MAG: hypothetical protein ABS56_16350 [Lautropia sp. SCN 69-89]|nr:MAG: hypothetical protein ABS56_16350 [Lautropia sp. SCN 69-89]